MIRLFLLLSYCIGPTFECAATSPGGGPRTTTTTLAPGVTTTTTAASATTTTTVVTTTTTVPTTTTTTPATTTTTTTTTVAPTACTTCSANDIDFDTADPALPFQFNPTYRLETDANDCSVLVAICTADAGLVAFMEFNVNQGGPAENQDMGQIVEASLQCIDGQWYYDTTRPVNSVHCQQAANG